MINDYGTPTAAQKKKSLETNAATKEPPAVKNGCIISLSYDSLVPGVQNVDAVEAIATSIHPDASTS